MPQVQVQPVPEARTKDGDVDMKAFVDADLCIACGLCEEIAPATFVQGDEVAEVIEDVVSDEAAAMEARDDCPTEAISLED